MLMARFDSLIQVHRYDSALKVHIICSIFLTTPSEESKSNDWYKTKYLWNCMD